LQVAIAVASVVVAVGFVLGWLNLQHKRQPNLVTVLVADFANHTGDPVFDGTLEPMFNVALEGARFISAYSRGDARKAAAQLPQPTTKLDEQPARLVAVSQGINVIVTGSLSSRGAGYKLSVEALDAVSGKSLASAEVGTSTKDEVLLAVTKLAAPIRKALGDATTESAQLARAETFTAGSLAAAHEYAIAQEASFAGKSEDALRAYSKAAEFDPQFGRAYSGMATIYRNLGQRQDAEKYFKLAIEYGGRMTERERFRTRGGYYSAMGKFQNCIEEFTALINQYPFDNIGYNNLAICYSRLRNMPKAVEQARKAVEVSPKAAMPRMNLSLYASYAGDFRTGEQEARAVQQINSSYEKSYFTLAYAQLGQGQPAQAAETYQKQEKISKLGASYANAGLADLAIYDGRFSDALRLLEKGAAAELAEKRPDRAAARYAALAYTQLLRGQKSQAITAIDKALANSKGPKLRFLAGRLLAFAGEASRAKGIAAELAAEGQTEPQVFAKVIQGEASLQAGDFTEAIKTFTEANRLLDTWIGRFDLGRAYLEAGLLVEADSELDRCVKRRGEAMELFVDDTPTYGYFPPVYYYQGRVREGLKNPTAIESYRAYLDIRGKAGEDPLLTDVRRRAAR
jgi:tetratricopeptide (TPR) repeat protein